MKRKHWSRKGRCPSCDVGTGSLHKESCEFAYILPPKHNVITKQGAGDAFQMGLLALGQAFLELKYGNQSDWDAVCERGTFIFKHQLQDMKK